MRKAVSRMGQEGGRTMTQRRTSFRMTVRKKRRVQSEVVGSMGSYVLDVVLPVVQVSNFHPDRESKLTRLPFEDPTPPLGLLAEVDSFTDHGQSRSQ